MVMIKKKKHTKWQKYLHTKTETNYAHYKVARNNVITELRRSKNNYEKDLTAKMKISSSGAMYAPKPRKKSNICQLELPDGSLTNASQEKAEILNKYFTSVFFCGGIGSFTRLSR